MERDKRGYWKPVDKIQYQPIFQWFLTLRKYLVIFLIFLVSFGHGIHSTLLALQPGVFSQNNKMY